MKFSKYDVNYWAAMLFAIWFAVTASAWAYLANLFISLPFGILSAVLWFNGGANDPNTERYKRIPIIWAIGIIISIIVLFLLIAKN